LYENGIKNGMVCEMGMVRTCSSQSGLKMGPTVYSKMSTGRIPAKRIKNVTAATENQNHPEAAPKSS